MPFSSSGVYTPPTGAENATPGAVIRAATWNTIFTDMSTALTQVGNYLWQPTTIAASYTVTTTDSVVLVTANAPTIVLPLAATKIGPVRIVGAASGIFASHNTIVDGNGAETINGSATFTLTTNYQVVTLVPISGGWTKY